MMRRWAARPERGSYQLSFTVRATVRRESIAELRAVLERMGQVVLERMEGNAGPGAQAPAAAAIPFAELSGVHFARLLLLEDSSDLDGRLIPASLVWMSEIDAPLERHVDQLAHIGGPGLDAAFGLCEGYPSAPTPGARRRYLCERLIRSEADYVNTVGRTADQIHREDRLHRAIEGFLDRRQQQGDLSEEPERVRADIQRYVRGEPSLAWATRRPRRPRLRWRLGELGHAAAAVAVLVLAAPVCLLLLPIYAVVLRLHERADPAPHLPPPDPEHEHRLAAIEDHVTQNQFSAIGYVKPGRFRSLTLRAVLWLTDTGARHVFTRASLAGIRTIHFAHWTVLDDRRRVLFTSNYDGSHESYMDDFIDKVAWALNSSFSNGVGYPKTRFLLLDGARREQAFKHYQRRHQIPTQVWHSAYPHLTAVNIENNAQIRSGLFGALARSGTEAWLRRL